MVIAYRKNSTMPSLSGMPVGYRQPIFFERDDVSSDRLPGIGNRVLPRGPLLTQPARVGHSATQ